MESVPPPMPLTQCLWTFVGIAFTLIVLARIDHLLVEKTSGHLSLVLPPIGETCRMVSMFSNSIDESLTLI